MAATQESMSGRTQTLRSVYVYEGPMRLWHWVNALAIVVLVVTGYLIGKPLLPSTTGEASDHFLMGYIRFAHFAAGYVFAIGMVGRLYWAIVGNEHAASMFFPAVFRKNIWVDAWHQLLYYLFIRRDQKPHVGPNALDQLAVFLLFTIPSIFLIFTGFALYGEGAGVGSWQDQMFGWIIPLFGGSQAVHNWHRLAMWVMIVYGILHIYLVFRQEVMTNETYVSTMISGHRIFKD